VGLGETSQERSERRYIVRISARDKRAVRSLAKRGVDLISIQEFAGAGYQADAVLTLAEIGALADDGHVVVVAGSARATSVPSVIDADEWFEAMLADLEGHRREA
jgi:hypothetical protein